MPVSGFAWLVVDDYSNSVSACCRDGGPRREILNTDAEIYGGSKLGNGGWVQANAQRSHGQPFSVEMTLPPLATVLLRHDA